MYICICNALTDRKLQDTISTSNSNSPDELYAACGCRAKCGKCVRVVREMLRDHGRVDTGLQPSA